MRRHQSFFTALSLPAFVACALLIGGAQAQQNFDKVEIKTEKLSPTTFVLFGAGGNVGVSVGEDALFIVDDQYAPVSPKILAALKQLSDKPIKFVLNTHWAEFDEKWGKAFIKTDAFIEMLFAIYS